MPSGETEAFATRLSAVEAEYIHEALDQTGLSRSDIVARGLRYYFERIRTVSRPSGRTNPKWARWKISACSPRRTVLTGSRPRIDNIPRNMAQNDLEPLAPQDALN